MLTYIIIYLNADLFILMQPLSVSDVALTVCSFGCYIHKFATIKVVSYIIVYMLISTGNCHQGLAYHLCVV